MRGRQPLWLAVTDGVITDLHRSHAPQPGMERAPWNSDAKLGERREWYTENWMRIPDAVLVAKGMRADNRGAYWSRENYQKVLVIRKLDKAVPDGFTNIPPIDGKPSLWVDDQWVVNESEWARAQRLLSIIRGGKRNRDRFGCGQQ